MLAANSERSDSVGLWVAAILSACCALITSIYIFDALYVQWSERFGWASVFFNPHSLLVFLLLIAWGGSGVLLAIVSTWWIANRKKNLPRRWWITWWLILFISCASFLPSTSQYVAITVILLGPGENSIRLQNIAAKTDSVILLDSLIARGAHPEPYLLFVAAYRDSPHVVSRLIKSGVDVNQQHEPNKITALHNAVEGRRYENARLLVGAGAKIDIPDLKGRTPLSLAREINDNKMLKILRQEHG